MSEGFVEHDEQIKQMTRDRIGELRWRTREGEVIKLRDIPDQHLRNIALMLMGFGYQGFYGPDRMKIIWLTALQLEWMRRREAGIMVARRGVEREDFDAEDHIPAAYMEQGEWGMKRRKKLSDGKSK